MPDPNVSGAEVLVHAGKSAQVANAYESKDRLTTLVFLYVDGTAKVVNEATGDMGGCDSVMYGESTKYYGSWAEKEAGHYSLTLESTCEQAYCPSENFANPPAAEKMPSPATLEVAVVGSEVKLTNIVGLPSKVCHADLEKK